MAGLRRVQLQVMTVIAVRVQKFREMVLHHLKGTRNVLNGHVARRLQFGGNDSEEEEGSMDSESDEPPTKQSLIQPPQDPKAVTNADNRTGIDQALAQLLEEVLKEDQYGAKWCIIAPPVC